MVMTAIFLLIILGATHKRARESHFEIARGRIAEQREFSDQPRQKGSPAADDRTVVDQSR